MSSSVEISMHIKDIVALIIKEKNITEGLYVPTMELSFGAGTDNTPSGDIMPTVKIGIKSIGIQKVEDDDTDNELIVDAKEINPPKKTRKTKLSKE